MKQSLFVLLVVLLFSGCSNDFLHPSYPDLVMMNDTIWVEQQHPYYIVKLRLNGDIEENTPFRVVYHSISLQKENFSGIVKDGCAEISFYTSPDLNYFITNGMQESLLKIDVGDGNHYGFVVVLKEQGKSYTGLTVYQQELLFEYSNAATINFENATSKAINWAVTKMPEWMTATQTQGLMEPRNLGYITFMIPNGLISGFDYSGEVILETSNPSQKFVFPITVKQWN